MYICVYVVVRVWLMFVHMYMKRSCLRCVGESETMSGQDSIFLLLAIY